jgi:hypothetical protein
VLVVPTGLLLFITQAEDFIVNPAFLCKLVLIAAAGLNALLFHLGPWRAAGFDAAKAPPRARAQALLSLLLWIGAIGCGRLLAYV